MRLFSTIIGLFLATMLLSPGIAGAVTVLASPSNPLVGQSVTVSVSAAPSPAPCPMYVNFGDGSSTTFICQTGITPFCGVNFSHSYASPGNFTVSSGSSAAACSGFPATASRIVTVTAPCTPISIATASLPAGTLTQPYSVSLVASGGTAPRTWALTQLDANWLPAGLTLTPAGLITGTPTATGTWNINFSVTDSCSPSAQTAYKWLSLTINPPSCPALGIATAATLPNGTQSQPYSQQLLPSGGATPVTWSISPLDGNVLPAGLSLTPTGLITGTPTATGSFSVNLTATDSCPIAPQSASRWFSITIVAPPCPTLTMVSAAGLPNGTSGQLYSQQLVASGGKAPVNWSLSPTAGGALPPGLTLTPSGLITGTPAATGTWNVNINTTDSCTPPQIVGRTFSITIVPAPCAPLTLTAPGVVSALTLGQPFSAQFITGGGAPPITQALLSGSLPPGLSLTPAGLLVGTPASAGTFPFSVRATDSCASGPQNSDRALTLTVAAPVGDCPLLNIVTPQLPPATVGQAYSNLLATAGGQGAITFNLLSGSLPPGMSLSPSGLINGTPGTSGTFPISVQAADSCATAPRTATKAFTLSVSSAAAPAATFNLAVSPPMASIQRRSSANQLLTYMVTSNGPMSGQLQSTQGVFLAGDQELGVIATPITIPLNGMTAMATESLVIPVAVTRRAEEAGYSRMTYQRLFSDGSLTLRTSVEIFLATGATADFRITRLQLSFDNGRAETTVRRNQPGLKLMADIRFSGSGLLQGYWEVDGRILAQVNQHLVFGTSVTLSTPQAPALPTFVEGSHRVRLVITNPAIDFTLPEAIYFVTSEESMAGILPLRLLEPQHLAQVAYAPIDFSWEGATRVVRYLIEISEREGASPMASAYTKKPGYLLPGSILQGSLTPGKSYFWKVKGFDQEGNQVAESPSFRFTFHLQESYRLGRILLLTEGTGDQAPLSARLRDKYGLIPLSQFDLETLNISMAVYATEGSVPELVAALALEPGILLAQPDYIFRTLDATETEPLAEMQSLHKLLNIQGLHQRLQGKGIRIAVIDTGIDSGHQDLKNRLLARHNLLEDSPDVPELHGTAVAGIIAAERNGVGISGIAPGSKILALRACRQLAEEFPQGECYSSAIARALDIAIAERVQITNMSYGAAQPDPIVSRLLDAGHRQGMLFVAPVGNNPLQQTPTFPASHPAVIAVAGTDEEGRPLPNAALSVQADVSAPAENIFTTIPGDRYNFLSGTSFSSATITGLLALASEQSGQKLALEPLPEFHDDLCQWQENLLKLSFCAGKTARQ